jgi:hypothetical protein
VGNKHVKLTRRQLRRLIRESFSIRKTLFVFDFDDTLAHTDSMVRLERDSELIDLDSGAFAAYSFQPGDQLDFADFNRVNGKLIANTLAILNNAQRSGQDIVIITARPPGAVPGIQQFFADNNMESPPIFATSGSANKLSVMRNLLIQGDYDHVIVYEDCMKNIEKLGDVVRDMGVSYSAICIDHDTTMRKIYESIISEAMFDANRAFRDAYSQLDPDQQEKLEPLRKTDPVDYHLQVDSLGDYESPTYDSYEDLFAQSDMMLRKYGATFSRLEPLLSAQQAHALEAVENADVVIGHDIGDGVEVKGVPGLDSRNFYDIISKINDMSDQKFQTHMHTEALVHMIISRSRKTTLNTFVAEDIGILHYIDPTTYTVASGFRDLYAEGKIEFTGMTRKGIPIEIDTSIEV